MNHLANQEIIDQIQINYDNIPLAVFLLGTNGSGKSSLRNYLNLSDIQTNIDPDVLSRIYKTKNPTSYPIEAGRQALKMYDEALKDGLNICLESTLAGSGTMQRIFDAKDLGYHIITYFIGLNSVELNLQRIAKRVVHGGHWVSDDLVRKRYTKSAANLTKIINCIDVLHVVDNSDEYFKLQFSQTGDSQQKYGNQLEAWAAKLLDIF